MEKILELYTKLNHSEMQEHSFFYQFINMSLLVMLYFYSHIGATFFKVFEKEEALMYTRITFLLFILINYMKVYKAGVNLATQLKELKLLITNFFQSKKHEKDN